ncbi:MAG TPA: hypothetical protein VML94_08415 [Thermoplasmata archaeon]|nr:hypothetical protein [Thermoplasmata archaeon]
MRPATSTGTLAGIVAFFRRHPVLLLLAFTPGIPEYLSGSSSTALLVASPVVFFLFLGLNLGLYGPGVLLLREAWIRWGRSWGSLLLFGAAYGLLEEGTALSTLFNPNASVVNTLGHYGRAAGVNWVWLIGVLGIHIVLSVGLPILLLGLALPETRGRSLLSRRESTIAVGVYAADILALVAITGFWRVEPGWLVGAVAAAAALWVAAVSLPRGFLDPPGETARLSPSAFFFLGVAFFPILLLVPAFGEDLHLPAPFVGLAEILLAAALFLGVRQTIGRRGNAPHLILLSFGATVPIALIGLVSQIRLPIELVVDGLYGAFFWQLWRHYQTPIALVVPSGAAG